MYRTLPFVAFLGSLTLPMCSAQAQEQKLPDGPGKDVFVRVCSACHGPQIVVGRSNTEDGWTQVVLSMIQRGAEGTEDDFAQIVQYLTTSFPANGSAPIATADASAPLNVNKASADQLRAKVELTDKEAQSIVDYREKSGPFKSLDDLKKVPNVDGRKIDAHKDRLTF